MNNRTVLLVIDAQVNMFAPENPVYASEMLLRTLGSLIVRTRSANIPIIYVQNNGGPDDPDQPGTSGWLIHPALAPCEGDVVIQKETPDAFYQTSLQEELIRRSIKQVVLIGMQTEYCIDTTCRRAFALDYQVTLVKDGHSTYDTKRLPAVDVIAHHNALLAAFATVVEADANAQHRRRGAIYNTVCRRTNPCVPINHLPCHNTGQEYRSNNLQHSSRWVHHKD